MKTIMQKYRVELVKESSHIYETTNGKSIGSPADADEIARTVLGLASLAEEQFWMICLNTKNNVIGLHMVSQGTLNESVVHPREVFKRALVNNAAAIIVLHNHPSGDARPSALDVSVTERLKSAGELLGVKVLDHLVIGENNYASLNEQGLM